jgi:gluconate 2-dehydrogenase gamma chain
MDDHGLSRRRFLISGASVGAAAALPAAPAQAVEIRGREPWVPHQADVPHPLQATGYVFFTHEEIAFVEAATERLIPADELGPGAKACNVPLFIDHQLAGAYGRAQTWYMQGPWKKGEKTQGFQSRFAPADMYRAAIKAIDAHVAKQQQNKKFADLPGDAQDKLLSEMEKGKVELSGVDASAFFKILLQNTKEGMFSDPIYGGNKDMAAWKMIGFPGARYDYRDWVDKHGQRYDLPPVGIAGRAAWNQKA